MDRTPEKPIDIAVSLLEPFPWDGPSTVQYSFQYPQPWHPCYDEDHAHEYCSDIADRYAQRLRAEKKSLRLKEFREKLQDLSRSNSGLVRELKHIPLEVKDFLEGDLFISEERSSLLGESELEVKLRRRPKWQMKHTRPKRVDALPGFSSQVVPQVLSVVEDFGTLVEQLLVLIKKDTRLGERKDQGGTSSVFRLLHPPPIWALVRDAWGLFASSAHLRPSTTAEGPLERFIGALHEHATGENISGSTRLTSTLKQYGRCVANLNRCQADLIALLSSMGVDDQQDIEDSWYPDDLEKIFAGNPERQRAIDLYSEWNKAQLTLEFGPYLVKLHST